jgi:hypothetical protein
VILVVDFDRIAALVCMGDSSIADGPIGQFFAVGQSGLEDVQMTSPGN